DKKPKEDPRETGGENETDEDEKVEKDENGDRNGERLPKTATQSYNMLLIGSLALLIGLSTYIWYRFQQRKQSLYNFIDHLKNLRMIKIKRDKVITKHFCHAFISAILFHKTHL